MKREQISIIIAHYNQEKYLLGAILSVINQTYNNIQLIITDDCSKTFDKKEIETFIKKYDKNNTIKKLNFVINQTNIGTIKTLNKALDLVTSRYVLFFAADDLLYDDTVINQYVKYFKEEKIDILVFKTILYYNDFIEIVNERPQTKQINSFNKKSVKQQHKQFIINPFLLPGSIMFKTKILKDNDYFEKENKYIEDWPLFLKLSERGYKFFVKDINGLKHRYGGISTKKKKSKSLSNAILKDYYLVFSKYIFPHIDSISKVGKKEIARRLYKIILMNNNSSFKIWRLGLDYFWKYKKEIGYKYIFNMLFKFILKTKVILSLILSLLLTFLIFNNSNNIYILTIVPLLYYIIYIIMFFIEKKFNKRY